eukprot:m.125925 g.125925  ORF g.125925 m.125925 type:complete len:52 (+) comp17345_c0_seq2:1790-1945(+)
MYHCTALERADTGVVCVSVRLGADAQLLHWAPRTVVVCPSTGGKQGTPLSQ